MGISTAVLRKLLVATCYVSCTHALVCKACFVIAHVYPFVFLSSRLIFLRLRAFAGWGSAYANRRTLITSSIPGCVSAIGATGVQSSSDSSDAQVNKHGSQPSAMTHASYFVSAILSVLCVCSSSCNLLLISLLLGLTSSAPEGPDSSL